MGINEICKWLTDFDFQNSTEQTREIWKQSASYCVYMHELGTGDPDGIELGKIKKIAREMSIDIPVHEHAVGIRIHAALSSGQDVLTLKEIFDHNE